MYMIQIARDNFSVKFPPKESRKKTRAFHIPETYGGRNLNTTDAWVAKKIIG